MKNTFLAAALLVGLTACDKENDPDSDSAAADFPTDVLQPTTTTVRLADLPAPFASMAVTNFPQVVAARPANARLHVPQGYAVNVHKKMCQTRGGWPLHPTATFSWPKAA